MLDHRANSYTIETKLTWSCGSRTNGHLSDVVRMVPFCMDVGSEGSIFLTQLATVASSTRTWEFCHTHCQGILRTRPPWPGEKSMPADPPATTTNSLQTNQTLPWKLIQVTTNLERINNSRCGWGFAILQKLNPRADELVPELGREGTTIDSEGSCQQHIARQNLKQAK